MNRARPWIRCWSSAAAGCAITLALLAGTVGCGIPADDQAVPVIAPAPYRQFTSAPPVEPGSGTATEVLYLTRGQRLLAVRRTVPVEPTVERQLVDLESGPTRSELDLGLDSALAGTGVIVGSTLAAGQLEIALGDGLDGVTAATKLLAIAQIVCTMDERDDVTSVVFTRNGKRSDVPRGDGSSTNGPLTLTDYAVLIDRA